MSKIDPTFWRNPYTEHGLRLPTAQTGDTWQIHEAGMTTLPGTWQHRRICSPFWRLFYGFSAGVWVRDRGRRRVLDPTRLVMLPAGVVFDCGSEPEVEHLWMHFSLPDSNPASSTGIMALGISPAGRAVVESLRVAIEARRAGEARHLGLALLHVVFADSQNDVWGRPDPRLQRVLAWLEHHLSEPISNRRLGAEAGLGVEAFIRWFKKQTGRTPASYVAETRVREACRRLTYEDQPIDEIAETVGFKNRHHFSRVFKQYAGCGPAAFRRDGGNG